MVDTSAAMVILTRWRLQRPRLTEPLPRSVPVRVHRRSPSSRACSAFSMSTSPAWEANLLKCKERLRD